ncbi:homocysteine S-methyltransferase family protein [Halomonas sp. 7T]|uniref:homocysteine S-methyltransferase family protein n=1 Tax=Halomonas sp. 7T TaxID=2893469 RepID=UPI0021D7D57A|nr:homocysteine S-methyltransferase family protein [Halomonas sp. 7T]UXZ53660.1 homocysteine S-methyltransferase family protein [Halomonas sp. 7T]
MTAKERQITLLDGGMGQELRRRSRYPASPLWSAQVMLDEPHLVTAAHRDFIEAGADIITLNNYSATPQRLARDGDPALFATLHGAALASARQAQQESGRAVLIAGCLPPLVASYHHAAVPDDKTCLDSYRQLVGAQEGVDLFICETMSLAREALAATTAAVERDTRVWTAFTVDDSDGTRLRSGELLADAAQAIMAAGAEKILVNCSVPEAITTAMGVLAAANIPFGGFANGFTSIAALQPGGTVDTLTAREDLGPQAYADYALQWVEQGATVVGGCCEVGPAHIAAIATRLINAGYTLATP